MCATDLERELTAQQHLFQDHALMRAHIVTVINSSTRGPAVMMMGNLTKDARNPDAWSDEFIEDEDWSCTFWKPKTARMSSRQRQS